MHGYNDNDSNGLLINDFYFLPINACQKFTQNIHDLIEILMMNLISDFEGKFHEERNVFS